MSLGLFTEENRKWWTTGALSFSLFMIMLDNTVVNVALPAIQLDLQIDLEQLEWTINAYVLSFAMLLLSGGKLADFFGRRRIFLLGLFVFTVSSLVCGLATSGSLLIGARAVQGVGAALMLPATLSIISATFPPHERGTAIGIWAGVSLLGLGVGPLVGGVLVQDISWNWIFYINVPIGAVGLVVARLVVRESRDPSAEQRLDFPGLFTSALALFALTFGLIEANTYGWGSLRIVVSFAAAAVLFAAFVMVERRQRLPMLDLSLFRNSTFTGANLVTLMSLLSLFGVFFFLSIFVQGLLRYSPVQTGGLFLPMTGALVIVTPLAGKLSDRFGSRWPATVGMFLIGGALIAVSRIDQDATFWDIAPWLVLGGIGFGLTTTPATVAVLRSVPIGKSGVASGVVNTFRQVGGALGVAVMGAIVASQVHDLKPDDLRFYPAFLKGYQDALLAGGLIALAGGVTAALLIGEHRHRGVAEVAGGEI